jgi:hypothetical protein
MTSESRLEMVRSSRSIRGFHDVQAYFGVFQTISLSLSLFVLWASLAVR